MLCWLLLGWGPCTQLQRWPLVAPSLMQDPERRDPFLLTPSTTFREALHWACCGQEGAEGMVNGFTRAPGLVNHVGRYIIPVMLSRRIVWKITCTDAPQTISAVWVCHECLEESTCFPFSHCLAHGCLAMLRLGQICGFFPVPASLCNKHVRTCCHWLSSDLSSSWCIFLAQPDQYVSLCLYFPVGLLSSDLL